MCRFGDVGRMDQQIALALTPYRALTETNEKSLAFLPIPRQCTMLSCEITGLGRENEKHTTQVTKEICMIENS